jgi:Asp-tRNA(Asn)/Glu-tRNA(Gln) amidotransferase A subunit family amidase
MPLCFAMQIASGNGQEAGRTRERIHRSQSIHGGRRRRARRHRLAAQTRRRERRLFEFDGIGQAELVRSKQATALELVDSAIACVEAANPQLNAVVLEMFERARTRAKRELPASPLTGVPYLIKDLNNVAGERTTWGSRFSANTPAIANDPMPQAAE